MKHALFIGGGYLAVGTGVELWRKTRAAAQNAAAQQSVRDPSFHVTGILTWPLTAVAIATGRA